MNGWVSQGGAFLGIKRTLPSTNLEKCAERFREHKIQGLLVVGGFEVRIFTKN